MVVGPFSRFFPANSIGIICLLRHVFIVVFYISSKFEYFQELQFIKHIDMRKYVWRGQTVFICYSLEIWRLSIVSEMLKQLKNQ